MTEFETKVSGIPCICRVTHYYLGTNFTITSASLEPNDPEEWEFEILDRNGRQADWLEIKLTSGDEDRLFLEFKEYINADPY